MDPKLAAALGQMTLNSSSDNASMTAGASQGGAAAYVAEGAVGGQTTDNGTFSKVFECLQGYVGQEAALACRAVCKDWKKGVDKALSGETGN